MHDLGHLLQVLLLQKRVLGLQELSELCRQRLEYGFRLKTNGLLISALAVKSLFFFFHTLTSAKNGRTAGTMAKVSMSCSTRCTADRKYKHSATSGAAFGSATSSRTTSVSFVYGGGKNRKHERKKGRKKGRKKERKKKERKKKRRKKERTKEERKNEGRKKERRNKEENVQISVVYSKLYSLLRLLFLLLLLLLLLLPLVLLLLHHLLLLLLPLFLFGLHHSFLQDFLPLLSLAEEQTRWAMVSRATRFSAAEARTLAWQSGCCMSRSALANGANCACSSSTSCEACHRACT